MTKRASNRRRSNQAAHPARRRWLLAPRWYWVGVALAGVAAVAVIFTFWPRAGSAAPLSAARLARDPSLGLASAPIRLVEYGDFG